MAYVSLHAYSQLWMAPWAYTLQQSPDYSLQMALLKQITDKGN